MRLNKFPSATILFSISILNLFLLSVIIWLVLPHSHRRSPGFNLPLQPDYESLSIEELAMRFRYPGFYQEREEVPRRFAVLELLRRKALRLGMTREDVDYLLGDPYNLELQTSGYPDQWNYGNGGGNLVVEFKDGRVARVLQTHDGEPDHAHTDTLLP